MFDAVIHFTMIDAGCLMPVAIPTRVANVFHFASKNMLRHTIMPPRCLLILRHYDGCPSFDDKDAIIIFIFLEFLLRINIFIFQTLIIISSQCFIFWLMLIFTNIIIFRRSMFLHWSWFSSPLFSSFIILLPLRRLPGFTLQLSIFFSNMFIIISSFFSSSASHAALRWRHDAFFFFFFWLLFLLVLIDIISSPVHYYAHPVISRHVLLPPPRRTLNIITNITSAFFMPSSFATTISAIWRVIAATPTLSMAVRPSHGSVHFIEYCYHHYAWSGFLELHFSSLELIFSSSFHHITYFTRPFAFYCLMSSAFHSFLHWCFFSSRTNWGVYVWGYSFFTLRFLLRAIIHDWSRRWLPFRHAAFRFFATIISPPRHVNHTIIRSLFHFIRTDHACLRIVWFSRCHCHAIIFRDFHSRHFRRLRHMLINADIRIIYCHYVISFSMLLPLPRLTTILFVLIFFFHADCFANYTIPYTFLITLRYSASFHYLDTQHFIISDDERRRHRHFTAMDADACRWRQPDWMMTSFSLLDDTYAYHWVIMPSRFSFFATLFIFFTDTTFRWLLLILMVVSFMPFLLFHATLFPPYDITLWLSAAFSSSVFFAIAADAIIVTLAIFSLAHYHLICHHGLLIDMFAITFSPFFLLFFFFFISFFVYAIFNIPDFIVTLSLFAWRHRRRRVYAMVFSYAYA